MEVALVTLPAGGTQDAAIGPQERSPTKLKATVQSEEDGAESASGSAPAGAHIDETRILGTTRWRQFVDFLSPLTCQTEKPPPKKNPWIGAVVAGSSSDSTAHGDSDSPRSSEPAVEEQTSSDGTTSEDALTPPVDGALSRRQNVGRKQVYPGEDEIVAIERDVEEAITGPSAAVLPEKPAVAKASATEPGLVLPCAPSDDEKVWITSCKMEKSTPTPR